MGLRRTIFGKVYAQPVGLPNTFIGGVSTITTAAQLATSLGIVEDRVSNFEIKDGYIKAIVSENYNLPYYFKVNEGLTFFDDKDGLIQDFGSWRDQNNYTIERLRFPNGNSVSSRPFRQVYNLKELIFDYTTSFLGSIFDSVAANFLYIGKATTLGSNVGLTNIFNSINPNCKVYVNPFLATNNGGNPDGDIAYLITNGNTVVYVQNFTKPEADTNFSISAIYATALQLNFTPPSSVNAIDFYECYANGIYKNNVSGSGDYIIGLNPDTTYEITVKAVDIYYNKSDFSNPVSDTTNTTEPYPFSNIISYYRLEGNALDVNNVNHGTPTAITYEAGLVGQRAIFNGTTSRIIFTNNVNLQLSQGSIVIVINSTNSGSSYRGIVIKQMAYGLFLSSGVLVIYSWGSASGIAVGEKSTGINLNDGLNHVIALTFNAGVVNGTKIYLDGELVLTTSMAISNQTKSLVIGAGGSDAITQQINAKIDDSAVFNTILTATQVSEITSKLQSGQSLI